MARNTHFRLPALGRVALPPLVERELRTGARRPLFYWLRGLLALAAGFQGYELLDRFVMAPPPAPGMSWMAPAGAVMNGAILLHQMAWLLFLATLLMGLINADSINRERRDGTLGLLLLTDLSPEEIVWGKMLSCGLTSFLVLLGALPALMFPVLAGGVTGREAALIALGLLNRLFVSLTAGLWMSTVFLERRHAVPATMALVVALAFGPEVLGGACFGTAAAPFFRLFGLAGWMTAARMTVPFNVPCVVWFIVIHTVGWLFLWRARVTLATSWQDQPHQQVREPEPAEAWPSQVPAPPRPGEPAATPEPAIALARVSWLTDPRPWDADPIRWRVERLGSVEGLLWLAVAMNFCAQFGTLGSILGFGAGPADTWGLVSFVGMAVILFSSGLIAWLGVRFFQDTRRQQDLELLLTTPLGSRRILSGQWCVLRRALAWPLGVVLALALPAGIALIYDFAQGYRREFWSLLQPFLIAVNLALEAVALCWVGIRFGLRGRNAMIAVAGTVGLVQLLPLAVSVVLMWGWSWLPGSASFPAASRGRMPPIILALLCFVAKNLALILWARHRLHRELRLGRQKVRPDASAPRRVLPQA